MLNARNILFVFIILFFSCQDERNNPYLSSSNQEIYILMSGPTRGLEIINDFNASDLHLNPTNHGNSTPCNDAQTGDGSNCYGNWCEWEGACNEKKHDLLIVSNREGGLFIYNLEDYSLVFHQENIEPEDPNNMLDSHLRDIYFSTSHNTLYMIDEFEFIYPLYLPKIISSPNEVNSNNGCPIIPDNQDFLDRLEQITCYNTSKFTFNENNSALEFDMFALLKHRENYCGEGLTVDDRYSEIVRFYYDVNETTLENYLCNGIASNESFDREVLTDPADWDGNGQYDVLHLNYDVTDIFFNNNSGTFGHNKLFVSNAKSSQYSVDMFVYNGSKKLQPYGDSFLTEEKVRTIYSYGNYLLAGLKDKGCYITLLNAGGFSNDNNDKLQLVDDMTVIDIYYDDINNKLLLSCGIDGVLIYDWSGESLNPILYAHIPTSYAYTTKLYNNKIIVGTKNGVEIYNLGD